MKMNESIRRKQMQREKQMRQMEQSLKVEGKLVSDGRAAIVTMQPMNLLAALRNGDLSATTVLQAFQSKALELNKKINCVTEFIPEAEVWAKKCDATSPEERGPLHGLPVSLKENIAVKGMDTTIGLAKYLYNPSSSNAIVVELLLENGAVPFCKTNLSQTMLSFCCSNPVYGETYNPHDKTRSPGGSSGGEGALIGGGGSVLGIGTDLGGSVRVPANFSGCIGLKPTSGRISSNGVKKALEGMQGVAGTAGIMGADVDIVAHCMEVLSQNQMHKMDSILPPCPWNEVNFNSTRKLVFGYYDDIPHIFPTSPGVKRAIYEARCALEKAGHETVSFDIENINGLIQNFVSLITADDQRMLRKHLEGEYIDPSIRSSSKMATSSAFTKIVLGFILAWTSPQLADMMKNKCTESYKLWEKMKLREKTIKKLTDSMKRKRIDLILSPVYPLPAPPTSILPMLSTATIYTTIFNYLDFPSGSIPVTHETEKDQGLLKDYPQHQTMHTLAKMATKGATNLPIGVEVTGLPWEDELVCKGMMELQEALKVHGRD